jgi:hypothetical protein
MFQIRYQIVSITFLLFLSLTQQAYPGECVHGNNHKDSEKRKVEVFHAVDIQGAFNVDIQNQQEQALTVTTDTNLLPYIITKVQKGTLCIYADRSICTKLSLAIHITGKDIKKIQSSGANDISYSKIQANKLEIVMDDAGKIQLFGKAKIMIANLSDAVDMEAGNLHTEEVKITNSGAGDATVYASETLNAIITDAGTVTYHGNPKVVTQKISDAGELVRE